MISFPLPFIFTMIEGLKSFNIFFDRNLLSDLDLRLFLLSSIGIRSVRISTVWVAVLLIFAASGLLEGVPVGYLGPGQLLAVPLDGNVFSYGRFILS